MEELIAILNEIDSIVWGPPLIVLLVGTGIYLTLRLGFVQIRQLPLAIRLIFSSKSTGDGDISSFKALCVALAATVGTGNIVGVATALKIGGPGALFWVITAAAFGMATKYAEGVLAVKYRSTDRHGMVAGGPMYYIEKGMGPKYRPMAVFFAFAITIGSIFGIGTLPQVNAIIDSAQIVMGADRTVANVILTVLVGIIFFGGLKNIAKVSGQIVPFMAAFYFLTCMSIVLNNISAIPDLIALVVHDAFTGTAAAGGFAGSTVMMAVQYGVARGFFSNEAGLGSAPIVAAAAKTKWAAEQGLVSMMGTFIDTIVICMLTGLTILLTGAWMGDNAGAAMTATAFATVYDSAGELLVTVSLMLFAFTTIIGWGYYGERGLVYLVGVGAVRPYRMLYIVVIGIGAYLPLDFIWILADILNALMAVPNLIALIALSGVVAAETKLYLNARAKGEVD